MAHERDPKIIRQEERIHSLLKEVERLEKAVKRVSELEGRTQSRLDKANEEVARLRNESEVIYLEAKLDTASKRIKEYKKFESKMRELRDYLDKTDIFPSVYNTVNQALRALEVDNG